MLVNFNKWDITVLFEWKNILITHDYEKGEFSSSQRGGYGLDFKINKASLNTQVENISVHYISINIVVRITTRIDKSLIFWENFKYKNPKWRNNLNEIDWLLVFSQKSQSITKLVKVLFKKIFWKCMHLSPSLFWKRFKFRKQE